MLYLPDTNAISAYMRGTNDGLVAQMQAAFVKEELRLSVIVLAEREFGLVKGGTAAQRRKLQTLEQLLIVEPFTRADASHYAKIRHQLESRGQGIGPFDTLIVAQALRLGATVVTRNVGEFNRIAGLRVENWEI
ncbi:type II toxin-antitoxin system VapC family toxin [Oleiharenicola lentus]|uniref:type II toxin-antitoxin system VapC family toxin n=1 Tax=Oleiharenicola lentus TaxID=2508720 RepID=UPI003F67D27C